MGAWELPTALEIGGEEWTIRTDYRAIIDILNFFNDPEYEPDEKILIALDILYEDFESMPTCLHEEAYKKGMSFIDMGIKNDGKIHPRTMDWEQDAPLVISSVNKVLNCEIRSLQYMHWWTFLGAYMEIGKGLYSQILSIRAKKIKGQKIEKWERQFYTENKHLIDLDTRYSDEEKAEQERLLAIFD